MEIVSVIVITCLFTHINSGEMEQGHGGGERRENSREGRDKKKRAARFKYIRIFLSLVSNVYTFLPA